jgi:hypothetical protein
MADAEAGQYVGANLETRLRLIRFYRRQLENSGLDQVVVNNRVGRLNELFSETPRIVREGRAQTAFRSGERVLDDASLRGSSIPDITRVRSINGQPTRVHFNLKSDRIDQLSLGEATSRARRYTDTAEVQVFGAQTNETRRLRGGNLGSPERRPLRRGNRFGNLPEGEPPGIEYLFAPSREVQEAMVLEHFRPSSPIVEVRFGSITYVRTPTGFIRN